MGLGAKIKRGISNRLALARERRQLATEQRGREQAEYQEAYNRARLQRAKTEGKKAAYTKKRRETSFIRTDGPDPFGLFQQDKPKPVLKRKKKGNIQNYLDNLM